MGGQKDTSLGMEVTYSDPAECFAHENENEQIQKHPVEGNGQESPCFFSVGLPNLGEDGNKTDSEGAVAEESSCDVRQSESGDQSVHDTAGGHSEYGGGYDIAQESQHSAKERTDSEDESSSEHFLPPFLWFMERRSIGHRCRNCIPER